MAPGVCIEGGEDPLGSHYFAAEAGALPPQVKNGSVWRGAFMSTPRDNTRAQAGSEQVRTVQCL